MYHHILVKIKQQHTGAQHAPDVCQLDIKSFEQVEKDVIMPYLNGKIFELGGHLVSKEKIAHIKIFRSQYETEYYCKVQDERNRVRGFLMGTKKAEIIHFPEYMTDITKDAIKSVQTSNLLATHPQPEKIQSGKR